MKTKINFITWKPDYCEGCKFDHPEYLTVACTYPRKIEIVNFGNKCKQYKTERKNRS